MTLKRKTTAESYQVLSERDHIRSRPGMYCGQVDPHTATEFLYDLTTKKMIKKDVTYSPALIKIFSEIIDNAIDEYKRHPDILKSIKIDITPTTITVQDDGAGIPVELHHQTGKYVPETVFTNLRAGSNFNDEEDRQLIGTNGVGSSITAVLSSSFEVDTCDGKKRFVQEYLNGLAEKSEPKIKPSDKNGTTITFTPDFEYFKIKEIDQDHIIKMVKRVIDVAGCNPNVKFYINKERLNIKSFDDYVSLYQEDFIYDSSDDWKIAIAKSEADSFEQISFVNAVETYNGGTHVDYVFLQLAAGLREFFKKKHKIDVTPGMLKNHIRLFISCNIDKPRFNSQTKDTMVSEVRNYKTSYSVPDKIIQKLTKSEVIQAVLDWVQAKADAEEKKKLRELDKESSRKDPNRIPGFTDATAKKDRENAMLFLTEGLSAGKSVVGAKTKENAKYIGVMPLRGKPINVMDVDLKVLIGGKKKDGKETEGNAEFKNIMLATGLKLGEKVTSPKDLRFGKLVFCTDQDLDGFHIRGLLINMIYRFWPELFDLGIIYFFRTPVVKAFLHNRAKDVLNFYSEPEFESWKEKNPGVKFTKKYFKGLASSTSKDFREYFNEMDKHLIKLEVIDKNDIDGISLAFAKSAGASDQRKEWLRIE